MMMSMDYDIPKLLRSELIEIKSFHFYRLINPKHQDLMVCATDSVLAHASNLLLMLGWIFSLHCFMTVYWLLLME